MPYLNRLSDLLWTLARWQEGESLTTKSRTRTMTMIEFSLADDAGDAEVLVAGLTADGVAEAPDGLGEHLAARGFKAETGLHRPGPP